MTTPFSREAFITFLLEAKRHTYAGQGDDATAPPLVPDTKQLEYQSGPFFYRDIYVGMAYFVGQEIVTYAGHPVWSMSYAGGVVPVLANPSEIRAIYAFLRRALRQGAASEPYRGPARVQDGAYVYTNRCEGTLEAFSGYECIAEHDQLVYKLHYNGGFLR